MSPTARNLLREFNKDLERERRWKSAKGFIWEWAWVGYAAFLAWCLWKVVPK